jgi:hypothetical protein
VTALRIGIQELHYNIRPQWNQWQDEWLGQSNRTFMVVSMSINYLAN